MVLPDFLLQYLLPELCLILQLFESLDDNVLGFVHTHRFDVELKLVLDLCNLYLVLESIVSDAFSACGAFSGVTHLGSHSFSLLVASKVLYVKDSHRTECL